MYGGPVDLDLDICMDAPLRTSSIVLMTPCCEYLEAAPRGWSRAWSGFDMTAVTVKDGARGPRPLRKLLSTSSSCLETSHDGWMHREGSTHSLY